MADYRNVIPTILKWEGGLSRNPNDTASRVPAPWPFNGVTGWHTNKGVTYATFSSLAPRLGYKNDADTFFTMPSNVWGLIFKNGYWDKVQGDKIKSQAVANLLADWYWGSGSNAVKNLQQVLNRSFGYKLAEDGIMGPKTLEATNKVDAKKLFDLLHAEKVDFYNQIVKNDPSQQTFLKGWLNRAADLYAANKDIINTGGGIAVAALFFFLIYKFYGNRNI